MEKARCSETPCPGVEHKTPTNCRPHSARGTEATTFPSRGRKVGPRSFPHRVDFILFPTIFGWRPVFWDPFLSPENRLTFSASGPPFPIQNV